MFPGHTGGGGGQQEGKEGAGLLPCCWGGGIKRGGWPQGAWECRTEGESEAKKSEKRLACG